MLDDKNADLVVYNDVSRADIAFEATDNEVVLVSRLAERRVEKAPKADDRRRDPRRGRASRRARRRKAGS